MGKDESGFTVNLDGERHRMSLIVRYRKTATPEELCAESTKLYQRAFEEVEARPGKVKVE